MWASSACWTSDVEPGPVVVAGDVGVFCLGCLLLGSLWHLMLWFLRNVARNSPTCISNIEIASLKFCGFLDTYEKLGYPNYVRVLVDEAPQASSCVRSSSHDTVHDPRESSPLGSAWDQVQKPGGTTAIVDGRHIQDDGDVCVPVGGVAPHVFINANDTHPGEPCWIIDQQTRPLRPRQQC